MKDRGTAILLAILFGWMGGHKFYLNESGSGCLYAFLGFATAGILPGVLGWFDAFLLSIMSQQDFDRRYNSTVLPVVDMPTVVTIRRTVIGPDGQRREVVEQRVSGQTLDQATAYDDLIPVGREPRSAAFPTARAAKQGPGRADYERRRPADRAEAERFVLLAAADNQGSLSPAELSLMTKLGLSESRELLDEMVRAGACELQVDDEGLTRYDFPDLNPAPGRRMRGQASDSTSTDEELHAG